MKKLKARFCARGDRQIEGVDFFDTFAPVVNWTAVRLLLILTAQLGLVTKQVDYTAAFIHADIDLPPNCDEMSKEEQQCQGVYVEMPRSCTSMLPDPIMTPQGSGFHDTVSSLHKGKPNKETIPQAGALRETVLYKHERRDWTARLHDSQ